MDVTKIFIKQIDKNREIKINFAKCVDCETYLFRHPFPIFFFTKNFVNLTQF